ncbi:Processing alpha glucosidase I [Dispira parvispora]|uniref:Mannosyl-oligosaccharide glucosidase n=1 Tax=Dispira parvispora TaxID=1520584 RepID=A0A9W8E672_9FUNG|nr:Processing alpha glucosidase I [Dispira parvispora]
MVEIYSSLSKSTIEQVCAQYATSNTQQFKQDLAEVIIEALRPIQREMVRLQAEPGHVDGVLQDGAQQARELATVTYQEFANRKHKGMRRVFHVALWLLTLSPAWAASESQIPSDADEPQGVGTPADGSQSTPLWGTFRPNIYFGVRPRLPQSLSTGLMWYSLSSFEGVKHIRHDCEMNDQIDYHYQYHDGREFADQIIRDKASNLVLRTQFLLDSSSQETWSVRITGEPLRSNQPIKIGLVYYLTVEDQDASGLKVSSDGDQSESSATVRDSVRFSGRVEKLGDFTMSVTGTSTNQEEEPPTTGNSDHVQVIGVRVPTDEAWKTKAILQGKLEESGQARLEQGEDPFKLDPAALFRPTAVVQEKANVYMVHYTLQAPFEITVHFQPGTAPSDRKLIHPAEDIVTQLDTAKEEFKDRFEQTFALQTKSLTTAEITCAKEGMSNLLGGIGYFYGTQLFATNPPVAPYDRDLQQMFDDEDEDPEVIAEEEIQAVEFKAPVEGEYKHTEPMALFASTPSRSFFPRGFLWDEGFLQLMIGVWDNNLSLEILESWFSQVDEDGWLPREQILGDEARSKVPPEFQVQQPTIGNPPTLFLSVNAFVERFVKYHQKDRSPGVHSLNIALGPDTAKYQTAITNWQLGHHRLSKLYPALQRQFQWFRDTQTCELHNWGRNPPNGECYRWRGRTMNHTLPSGLDDYPRASPHRGEMHVDLLCWVGLMARSLGQIAELVDQPTDALEYQRIYEDIVENLDALHWNEAEQAYCDVTVNDDEESVFVCHKGYLSLFPLVLNLLPPDSPKVGKILDLIHDPDQLWSRHGIRSLSKSDPYYGQGENYWRGPVWININYLVLSALYKHYMMIPGPNQAKAMEVYKDLRRNLINTVAGQYEKTGFFWEQYSPETGKGQRVHPFTGWSALITLVIAEKYP